MSQQPTLFDAPPGLPEGFVYRPDLLSAEEEARLAGWMAGLPFEAFQFRGYEGRRRVVSFGWRYDFNRSGLAKAQEMPDELGPLRARAAALAGLEAEAFQHALLTEYAPGAPIGWHKDRGVFGEVVGISLLSPCTFRFRRRTEAGFARASLTLAPRSGYLLSGAARSEWEHSIPPVDALRYSITFRNFCGGRSPSE